MLKTRIQNIEKKMNLNQKELIVVFSQPGRCLLKRDGRGLINKIYNNIQEIKDLYKNRNSTILNISRIYDIDKEMKLN